MGPLNISFESSLYNLRVSKISFVVIYLVWCSTTVINNKFVKQVASGFQVALAVWSWQHLDAWQLVHRCCSVTRAGQASEWIATPIFDGKKQTPTFVVDCQGELPLGGLLPSSLGLVLYECDNSHSHTKWHTKLDIKNKPVNPKALYQCTIKCWQWITKLVNQLTKNCALYLLFIMTPLCVW